MAGEERVELTDKKQGNEESFTGTPEEKLPDLEAENLDEKQEEQNDSDSASGKEESED